MKFERKEDTNFTNSHEFRVDSCNSCLLFLTTCLFLGGCAVGPNYHRPNLDLPSNFRSSSPIPASTNSVADLPWWEIFQDEDLRRLIRIAYTNNYDLRMAIARVEQARGSLEQARSGFFPQINYAGSIGQAKNATANGPFPSGGKVTTTAYAIGNASWEIDLWGRIRRLTESARAQLLASEEARRGVMTTLLSEVASDYFQLLALDEQLQIAHESTNSFGQSLTIFTQRLQGGVASKLEAARAEAAQASAAATVPDLERQIIAQENAISVLTGMNPGPISRHRKLLEESTPASIPPGLPSSLLLRRPDIRQNEELLHSANAQVGVAVADFFPQLNLTGLFGQVTPELAAFTGGTVEAWSIAAGLTGPIFQGGQLRGRYHQALAQWDEARWRYQSTVLTAMQEVSNALVAREKYGQAALEQARAVRANQVAVEVSMQRYVAGKAGYFELLEAQQQLFPAENALVQAQVNQLLSFVQLYRSLGGGWSQELQANNQSPNKTK
jgi:multidrug efflux system outer membrane protein